MPNWKKILTEVGKSAATIATGGVSDRILAAIGEKVSPAARLELEDAARDGDTRRELAKIESTERVEVAKSAASIIIAEAQSDNWLAKTARPGSIWATTILIVLNYLIPLLTNNVIRLRALWIENWHEVDLSALPTMKPEEIPAALFGVWATSIGGYIWSRRAEKRDQIRAENGLEV